MKLILCPALIGFVSIVGAEPNFYSIHTFVDPVSGVPAYRYLLPKGWTANDQLTWNKQDRLTPAQFSSTLTSADGETQIQLLPPIGSNFEVKSGNLTGLLPPQKPSDALGDVFSHFNPNLQGTRKDEEDNLDVPFEVGSGMKSKGLCGILQFTFRRNNKQYVEYLTGAEYEYSKQADNGDVSGSWRIANDYTITAPQTDFQKAYTLFASVASSVTTTPAFFQLILKSMQAPPAQDIDPKQLAAGAGNLGSDEKAIYEQSLVRHRQAVEKIFPIFHNPAEYGTDGGPMLLFGSFAVFADSSKNVAVDSNASAAAPSGFNPLKPLQ